MKFKPNGERAFAEFAAEQCASAEGQTMLRFMEEWSAMMECAIEHGANDTAEIASITLYAAAETTGVTEDHTVIIGGANLLRFWDYGEGLKEWLEYSPVDGILDRASHPTLDVWYASPELLDALPEMVEAFPSILQIAPGILFAREVCLEDSPTESVPTMSM